jgi:4-amino-4-deoxy-L-arabinose transferase-like glycosyltransferase
MGVSATDAAPHRALDRRLAWQVALGALAIRIASAVLGFLVALTVPVDNPDKVFPTASPFWDGFTRFDSGWYEKIARFGYRFYEDSRSNVGFFPVYPLLMRYVGRLFGTYHAAYYFGGIIVSWLSFVGAMVALYYLARLDVPRRTALRAVLLIAVFPFSYFFGEVYSESTFLLFAVLGFYGFRTRRWWLGGLAASVAIATRVPGILMLPALAWIAWRQAEPTVRDRAMAVAGLVLALGGFAWYCGFIYSLSGHPFAWVATIEKWDYHPGGAPWAAPARILFNLATQPYAYLQSGSAAVVDTLYGVTGLVFVLITPFVWYRLGAGYALFMLLNLWLPLSSGVTEGIGRYCSVLFPGFIWLATIRSRPVATALVVGSALLYPIAFAMFLTNHPLY